MKLGRLGVRDFCFLGYGDWGIITAGAVMAALPIIFIYLLLQGYVISGLTAGSV
jgi:arabinogalactan oligomer/maltooligosaccharide transport system permease protein